MMAPTGPKATPREHALFISHHVGRILRGGFRSQVTLELADELKIIRAHADEIVAKIPEPEPEPVDETNTATTDGKTLDRTIGPDGQQKNYLILSDEERAKGFVRPVRRMYKHVGTRPQFPLRDLTPEEQERYKAYNYEKIEDYPESMRPRTGRFWSKSELESGCEGVTTMSADLAETYARAPRFYGSTFCSTCRAHYPVGEHGEFVWVDNDGTVTTQKVGT